MKHLVKYFFILVAAWACKNKPMTPEAYIDFVQKEEKINKVIDKGDFKFKCSYRPITYIALTEMANDLANENAKLEFKEKLKQMGNGFYISINISNSNEVPIMLTNNGDRMLIPYYLQNNEALKDIEVKTKDGVASNPLQLIYNNQGNSPVLTMLVVFGDNIENLNQAFTVTYNNKFWGVPEKVIWEFDVKPVDFEREIIF